MSRFSPIERGRHRGAGPTPSLPKVVCLIQNARDSTAPASAPPSPFPRHSPQTLPNPSSYSFHESFRHNNNNGPHLSTPHASGNPPTRPALSTHRRAHRPLRPHHRHPQTRRARPRSDRLPVLHRRASRAPRSVPGQRQSQPAGADVDASGVAMQAARRAAAATAAAERVEGLLHGVVRAHGWRAGEVEGGMVVCGVPGVFPHVLALRGASVGGVYAPDDAC